MSPQKMNDPRQQRAVRNVYAETKDMMKSMILGALAQVLVSGPKNLEEFSRQKRDISLTNYLSIATRRLHLSSTEGLAVLR